MWLRVAVTLLACADLATVPADGARILAVEMMGGKSHWNFMSGVLRALVAGGHTVTAFTPFPDGDRENYTEVDISGDVSSSRDMDLAFMMAMWNDPVAMIGTLSVRSRDLCDKVYANGRMVEVLEQSGVSRFDLVITEPLLSECVSYVATRLDVPLIYLAPLSTAGVLERVYIGHLPNPAVVSHVMSAHGVPTTFVQRLANAALAVHGLVASGFAVTRLKHTDPKPYDSVAPTKPSLMIVNGNSMMAAPSPVSASVINVGGIHLTEAKGFLPEDILEFIEQSPNGVIYFSFGSTVKMSTVPDHIKKAFLTVFARLPQRVLMKYEEELEEKPKNIMTKKWLPQRDILMHPNVKLFISHGGISGLYETVEAGVPILGFPLFGDQPKNIDTLVNNGMAISMDLFSVTTDSFLKNVLDLLNDEKYIKNAKTASEIFKDQPMSPAQTVVYWTEYVIRHKGAPHLKSHALNLTWYEYFLLDVILTVLIFVFVVLFVTHRILKLVINMY